MPDFREKWMLQKRFFVKHMVKQGLSLIFCMKMVISYPPQKKVVTNFMVAEVANIVELFSLPGILYKVHYWWEGQKVHQSM